MKLSEQLKAERLKKFKYQQLDIQQNSKKIENSKDKHDSLYQVAYQYRLGYRGNIVIDSIYDLDPYYISIDDVEIPE